MTHYLRIEAVNIYASLFDTNQISIIRGGSLLLKQAIDDITLKFKDFLTPISTGASVGLFKVIDNPTIKDSVIEFLNTENNYRYFTFVVADAQSDDFKKAKEILIAKIRVLQLQQCSISVDGKITKQVKPCTVDGIRKAYKLADFPDRRKALTNPFARLKLVYGRRQRSKLYQNEFLELEKSLPGKTNVQEYKKTKFTKDLATLSNAPEFPSLDGKIAVIYFDGNGFSKIQAELVKNEQDQIEFDKQIKYLRRLFLFGLLGHCSQGFGWFNGKDSVKQLRLETLLWGGDEMLFVAPAWKGFEFMNFFYKTSQEWEITLNGKSKRLTHAGGIVFCQQNSPIYKMRDLAQQLADRIKNHPDEQGRNANYYDYLVLESIDYPAEDLDSFFSQRYGDLATYRTYLSAKELAAIAFQDFKNLREILPKSQVYAIALAARKLTITEDAVSKCLIIDNYSEFADSLTRLYQLVGSDEEKQQLEATLAKLELLLFPQTQCPLSEQPNHNMFLHDEKSRLTENIIQQALMWLNLVQCWDYLWPETIMPSSEGK